MTRYLYPRIDAHEAASLMSRAMSLSVDDAAALSKTLRNEARLTYAAVGAPRVPAHHLEELADRIRRAAREHGYPTRRDLNGQQRFDTETAIFLHAGMMAVPGEARRAETWQFLSAALVPDVILWRWREARDLSDGDVSHFRYLGGKRNGLGRLWLRADVFRDSSLEDEWRYVRSLSEDNFTSILERGNTARYRSLCRAIAGEYLARKHLVSHLDGSPEQNLLRQLMLRVTRASGHTALGVLDGHGAANLVGTLADQTLLAMGVTPLAGTPRVAGSILLGAPAKVEISPSPRTRPQNESSVSPETPSRASDEDVASEFLTLPLEHQISAVWDAVLGEGAALLPDLVRLAAENLRKRGQVRYQRLREDGPLYRRIEKVMAIAERKGLFDAPSRGKRRAVVGSVRDIPPWLWRRLLRSVLGADMSIGIGEVSRELRAAVYVTVGCALTPREIGPRLRALQAEELVSITEDGRLRAGPKLIESDPRWPEAR
jgi:hypothetical protein